jgi:hypothetical protein
VGRGGDVNCNVALRDALILNGDEADRSFNFVLPDRDEKNLWIKPTGLFCFCDGTFVLECMGDAFLNFLFFRCPDFDDDDDDDDDDGEDSFRLFFDKVSRLWKGEENNGLVEALIDFDLIFSDCLLDLLLPVLEAIVVPCTFFVAFFFLFLGMAAECWFSVEEKNLGGGVLIINSTTEN